MWLPHGFEEEELGALDCQTGNNNILVIPSIPNMPPWNLSLDLLVLCLSTLSVHLRQYSSQYLGLLTFCSLSLFTFPYFLSSLLLGTFFLSFSSWSPSGPG